MCYPVVYTDGSSTFESRSKTEVTAQLKLSKHAAERESAKAANTAHGRVPMKHTLKLTVLAAVIAMASMSFFSGQLGFSSEKAQTHTVSA